MTGHHENESEWLELLLRVVAVSVIFLLEPLFSIGATPTDHTQTWHTRPPLQTPPIAISGKARTKLLRMRRGRSFDSYFFAYFSILKVIINYYFNS